MKIPKIIAFGHRKRVGVRFLLMTMFIMLILLSDMAESPLKFLDLGIE